MSKYDFTLILKGRHELTETLSDELFAAGCDDGSPGVSGGILAIDFHRHAPSLEDAIRSAMNNVNSAGYEVDRAEVAADSLAAIA